MSEMRLRIAPRDTFARLARGPSAIGPVAALRRPLIHVFAEGRRDMEAFYRRAKASRPAIAAIGSTDFHSFAPVGLARTYLFARDASQGAVLDAIRRGATVACDGLGKPYGPAELVAVVAADCGRAATAAPAGSGTADTIATLCTWLGALALVLAGSFERRTDLC